MKRIYLPIVFILFTMVSMNAQFSDNMESYTDNEPISVGHWTDWGCGGGPGCAIMSSSAQAQGGILSGYIPPDVTTDAVLDLDNKIFGEWGLSFWAYIPSGKEAYFNLQGAVPIVAGEWIVGNIHFNQDTVNPGVGLIDDSALGAVNFNFPHDQWFRIIMNWDLTSGVGSATWQFNVSGIDALPPGTPFTDSFGVSPTALGGIDFFSISINNELWVDTFEYENNFISIIPDTEDPVAICQDITLQLDNNGAAVITGIDIDGGSTDNVGLISYTAVPDTFSCNDLGVNTVTLTVEDFAGNTDTCTAIVTVEDNINPIVNGQNIVGNLNGTGTVTIPVSSVDVGSSDNCSIDTLTLTPDTFTAIGTFNAVLEGTDPSGNSFSVTVTITIVDDSESPVAICQDITVQLDTNGLALITGNDIDGGSTDDFSIISYTATPDSFNCSNLGVNTVTLTVEDVIGNTDTCTAIVTIEDSINPIVVGQNATGDLDGLGTVTIPIANVNNGSNDNCSINTLTLTPDTYTTIGTYTAVLEGTDPTGNSDSVNVTIIIIDSSLGIEDSDFLNLKMYPNPVSEIINVENSSIYDISSIRIYNILGKLVFEEKQQFDRIDVSNLNSGVLFIKIESKTGVITKKIIKD